MFNIFSILMSILLAFFSTFSSAQPKTQVKQEVYDSFWFKASLEIPNNFKLSEQHDSRLVFFNPEQDTHFLELREASLISPQDKFEVEQEFQTNYQEKFTYYEDTEGELLQEPGCDIYKMCIYKDSNLSFTLNICDGTRIDIDFKDICKTVKKQN